MKCRRSKTSKGAPMRSVRASRARLIPAAPARSCALGPTLASAAGGTAASATDLRIDCPTAGSIHYSGSVTVGPQGAVSGGIRAKIIVVEGEVIGDLYADDAIRIVSGARVNGDVQAQRVAVAGGAQLRGRITMRRSPESDTVIDESAVEAMLTGVRQT